MIRRREFLGSLASGGLLATLPSIALSQEERAASQRPINDTWDLSWVERLRGTSRAVFDSPAVSEGGALFRAVMWRDQHASVFGSAKADLTPVVVFRHEAIPLIMDDAHWEHFGVGKKVKMKDPATRKWYRKNPLSPAVTDDGADMAKYTIPAFIASGGVVLACGLAFQEIVGQYREKDKLSKEDADRAARDHVMPGVILQPSGFFAVLKAQDEGCKYMLGS